MTTYKYELVAYGKTFELSEDNIDNPTVPFAVACHCHVPDCAVADVSPANSVIGDNGVLHVKVPIPIPPIGSNEWDAIAEIDNIVHDVIVEMGQANKRAEAGEEDAGEKTINGLVDANTGEVIVALKRIPLDVPKRVFFRVEDD